MRVVQINSRVALKFKSRILVPQLHILNTLWYCTYDMLSKTIYSSTDIPSSPARSSDCPSSSQFGGVPAKWTGITCSNNFCYKQVRHKAHRWWTPVKALANIFANSYPKKFLFSSGLWLPLCYVVSTNNRIWHHIQLRIQQHTKASQKWKQMYDETNCWPENDSG